MPNQHDVWDKVRYFYQYPWINNTSALEAVLVMVDMLSF